METRIYLNFLDFEAISLIVLRISQVKRSLAKDECKMYFEEVQESKLRRRGGFLLETK